MFFYSDSGNKMDDLWIYFLSVSSRLIKIGKSRKPRGVRLAEHRTPTLDGHVADIVELCEVRANSDSDEQYIHRYFSSIRSGVGKESFTPDEKLVSYIRWLRDEHYVVVPEDDDDCRRSAPLVDSDLWLPREDRVKPRDVSILPGFSGPFDLPPRQVTVDDFYTAQEIIEAARRTMGSIDLDPASHAIANRVVKASRFYTLSTNGLTQEWSGNVWCNPPFSMWSKWASKISSELGSGRVTALCALAATRTITARYFVPIIDNATGVAVMHGRRAFWGNKATSSPDDGHAVFYFGSDFAKFKSEFSTLGSSVFFAEEKWRR